MLWWSVESYSQTKNWFPTESNFSLSKWLFLFKIMGKVEFYVVLTTGIQYFFFNLLPTRKERGFLFPTLTILGYSLICPACRKNWWATISNFWARVKLVICWNRFGPELSATFVSKIGGPLANVDLKERLRKNVKNAQKLLKNKLAVKKGLLEFCFQKLKCLSK